MGSSPTSGTSSTPGKNHGYQRHSRVAQAGVAGGRQHRSGQCTAQGSGRIHAKI
ncbi:hypothetical protein ACWGQ2_07040 [Arthrobacter sp. NPDC055585]